MKYNNIKPLINALIIFLPFIPGILFIKQLYIEAVLFLFLVIVNYLINPMMEALTKNPRIKVQYAVTLLLGVIVAIWLNFFNGSRAGGIFLYISISLFFTYPITKDMDKKRNKNDRD
ncbi:hypothetical protein EKO29_17805 [Colwellia sp. Arc7-635]|uniref:hypothetical protein n=1 Tax=Colwellia sp. Arc7-635 TaxID=2497879 RepID=UPI000F85B5ED|nr:hypothetical protein [Colwellia sp. Arc7-635]AZQ85685.1 hypothetical protein EKO29_17805 [Colwellia sp. Arc7-635]